MKKIICLPLLFLYHFSFSQLSGFGKITTEFFDGNSQACYKTNPSASIAGSNAFFRCMLFRLIKNEGYKAQTHQKQINSISYSPQSFSKLLKDVTIEKYDGLRIYFGVYQKYSKPNGPVYPDNMIDKFVLIFVPTYTVGSIHQDDLTNCFVYDNSTKSFKNVDENKFIPNRNAPSNSQSEQVKNDSDYISRWIDRYQNYVRKYFQHDGQEIDKKFEETNSLWYSSYALSHLQDASGTVGLLEYLDCLIHNTKIDSVNIKFAGFGFVREYPFQLTLIFNFRYKKDINTFFTLSSTDMKTSVFGNQGSGSTDTGVPCPPPTNCSDQGAKLPQQ